MLAGYLYGTVYPRPVQSSAPAVAPALRDPNLTPHQIESIKRIQADRRVWLRNFSDQYRDELLGILGVIDTSNPDWTEVNRREAHLANLRRDYQDVQVRAWSDIREALTEEQGKQYIQALRELIRSLDFGHAAGPGR